MYILTREEAGLRKRINLALDLNMHEFTATVKSSFQLYGTYNAWYTESTHFLAAKIQHTMSENLSVCQQKHRCIQRESRIFVCSAAKMMD